LKNKDQIHVYIAGHNGMVGSAIYKELKKNNDYKIITKSRTELDLTSQEEVHNFFQENNIDHVYIAAAKVGGIFANNKYPADFIYENIMIQANIINSAHKANVDKLLFLGSSCIYPKQASQPLSEKLLLSGELEPTNEPYAIAKIAGIKLCESYNRQFNRDYRSVMPTNLYGPNDNFHPENSHVIPGLIRRFHEAKITNAKEVVAWGTGRPRREFLYVDDMASACTHLMQIKKIDYLKHIDPMLSHINIGTGADCSIKDLVLLIANTVNFKGKIVFDDSKPDGTPQKLLDTSKLNLLGWRSQIDLEDGLKKTYDWFIKNYEHK